MKRLILLILVGLGAALTARADIIYVQGDVSGTWSADTVMVTGAIQVPSGETLFIQPGVSVLFQVFCGLIVENNATLIAVGTETDSILFDVFPPDSIWHGIRFPGATDSSRVEYCRLYHGYAYDPYWLDNKGGAVFVNGGRVTISHSTISQCVADFGGGIGSEWSIGTLIQDNVITQCSASSGGGILCIYGDAIIRGNIIENNSAWSGGGIDASAIFHQKILIEDNTIVGNSAVGGGGVTCSGGPHLIVKKNVIAANSADAGGGIICDKSNPTILENVVRENTASSGGGIYCYGGANPAVSGNIISGNEATYGGGISCFDRSGPAIASNIFADNVASVGGAGVYCGENSNPQIVGNVFYDNQAEDFGGAIGSQQSSPLIAENLIGDNTSWSKGGGISCTGEGDIAISGNRLHHNLGYLWGGAIYGDITNLLLTRNDLSQNEAMEAEAQGGGLYLAHNTVTLNKSSLRGNYAWIGGGIYCGLGGNLSTLNGIIWGNTGLQNPQIYPGNLNPQITYTDVQGGWAGSGNINQDPRFADMPYDDGRLLWGSPCIDTGDPNPIYNDPDGTRADMGAFYYDQSVMVRILLTPHEIPYLIPESGGSMDYTIRGFNRDSLAHATTVWCDVTLPDSTIREQVLGPVTITLGAGALLERVRTQNVPAAAPMGVYHYNAYAIVGQDTSKDSFMFGKLGDSGQAGMTWSGGWQNTGEPITDVGGTRFVASANPTPSEFRLYPPSPNPFNATTTIRFYLPVAGFVKLEVFDIGARAVGARRASPLQLVDGWRDAGVHEVAFDGSGLASGVYIYRLRAGDFEATQKMALIK